MDVYLFFFLCKYHATMQYFINMFKNTLTLTKLKANPSD